MSMPSNSILYALEALEDMMGEVKTDACVYQANPSYTVGARADVGEKRDGGMMVAF